MQGGEPLKPDRSAADRLRELNKLHDERLITHEEYQAKRRLILDQI